MTAPGASRSLPGMGNFHLPPSGCVGVACSGGLDSVVLLELLHERCVGAPLELVVVHVDHGLRPESGQDARFVADLAEARGLACTIRRLDLQGSELPGLEQRAREARYEAFQAVAVERGLAGLYLAHHAGDQAESVIMRVLRGSGPRGLRGIPSERPLNPRCSIRRPLLGVARKHLRREAERRGLQWREDPTNRDTTWLRNRIRHVTLPALEAHSGFTRARVLDLADLARRVYRDLDQWSAEVGARPVRLESPGLLVVDSSRLRGYPDTLLHALLRPRMEKCVGAHQFGRRDVTSLSAVIGSDCRDSFCTLADGLQVARYGETLFIVGAHEPRAEEIRAHEDSTMTIGIGGCLRVTPVEGRDAVRRALSRSRSDPFAALLSGDHLRRPLTLRTWMPGMRYRPLNAPGRKMVADILAGYGVPSLIRNRLPVVTDRTGPVWVPPGPPAHDARIRADCSQAVQLTWDEAPSAVFLTRRGAAAT